MANIATYKIQFKSDFVLTIHGDAGWTTPFCIKFWTGDPSRGYFVGWDGKEYINCKVDETDASRLIVLFNDHGLPVGQLKMQMAWHTTIADFPHARFDEVMNQMDVVATVEGEEKHVELAFEGETAPEVEYFLPAYANEAQRIANEEQRIENEQTRIINEQQRIANEDGRISAEATRQAHELQRIHNEEARIAEFAQLKADAIAATDAANTAASLAQAAATLASDKAALAQAAATLANEKAQLAADKAALAQAAATLANDKAALAQQKAAYAQAQGDYAKAQGDYAKAQGDYAKEQGDTALADHERAEADHATAADDHTTAQADHTQAATDHATAQADHAQAAADHTTAASDHTRAEGDHTTAASDHSRAESDHTTALADHEQAVSDHTQAATDHTTAAADHTQAGNDHTRAESDHSTAASDHTTAAADHTQAVSDHNQAVQDHDTLSPTVAQHTTQIAALQAIVEDLETIAEGYVRVAGSSSPALSYKSYKYHEQGGFGRESVFSLFYPCLVGTPLTGSGTEGKVLHVLQKLDYGHDIYGNERKIDGTEGDVMIVNIATYFRIVGKHTIQGTEYDVFLVSRTPFTWQGIDAEEVMKGGVSPDYCVSHNDNGVTRMHSVYNPEWAGSYQDPAGIVGKYIYSMDDQTGEVTEQYDAEATLLGGAGGCHSTNIALYTGEQQAMNMNPDTTKSVPFANQTAKAVEDWFALMLAEGGTFDAHKAALMGSGFSSNDPATSAADWEESGSLAKNGIRIYDKNNAAKMYSPSANALNTIGLTGSADNYFGTIVNTYRNPFKVMEAHRAVCYAIEHGVHELEWFAFEGNKYKYRSVDGFDGPAQGEMTCVVWKMLSSKLGAGCFDPTDKTTSIVGNRIDLLFSVALFHGITSQVSPSWWTSGLVWTEDENGDYRSFYQKDQSKLVVTPNGEIATSSSYSFETEYERVGPVISKGNGYRKNYLNGMMALPDTDANKTGASLHTYVCAYNYYTGGNAGAGKKLVRGFRRGLSVISSILSPLFVLAVYSPSIAGPLIAFGTCCRIAEP